MTALYSEGKRWVFGFDLKEGSDRGRELQSDVLNGTHHRNTEYLRLSKESEKESRNEATQRGREELCARQDGSRWELFCKAKKWYGQIYEFCRWGKLSSYHSLNFIKENLKKNSKESITITKPRKRTQEFRWLQKKDTIRLNWTAWSPGKQADRVCSPVLSV